MAYEDNMFRRMNPAEIIRRITEGNPSLAMISLMTTEELERVGWLDNPIVDILYSLTSAGVWIARVDSSGKELISDSTLQTYQLNTAKLNTGLFYSSQTADSVPNAYIHRINCIPFNTDGAGAVSNTVLLAALAGYKGCVKVLGIVSNVAEASTTVIFQDEDDTVCEGNVATGFILILVASTINTQLTNALIKGPTANKAIELDVSGGPISANCFIYVETWYEAS